MSGGSAIEPYSLAIAGAVVGFTLVALAAILSATRGAARTDPMVVLRAE
jgi:hypothetical protein